MMKRNIKFVLLGVCLTAFMFVAAASGSTESSSTGTGTKSAEADTNIKTSNEKETNNKEKSSGPRKIAIGEEFGNKTISGVVIGADLDFKDYNDLWTTLEDGSKAVYIRIKVTNISDKSNYVSVGDFDCYVDDIITSAELVSGKDDYNANIDPGRSAILGALYVVPTNSKNIELEYKPIGERAERQIIVIQDETTVGTQISVEEDGNKNEEVSISDKEKMIGIGDEFGNSTIIGSVIDADLNYSGYNDLWTTVEDGKKAIYIKIKVTNVSEDSNYVSVGDFDCYVDDVVTTAELVSGGNEDYNANIEPGRSAILGAMYIIPQNANSIELEYHPIGESSERVIIKIL